MLEKYEKIYKQDYLEHLEKNLRFTQSCINKVKKTFQKLLEEEEMLVTKIEEIKKEL